jgi:putative glycosyltransferase (TIGR04348 family)
MLLRLVTPAPRGLPSGNQVTADRWARILRSLGHRVIKERFYRGGAADALIALHARKSFPSIRRFHRLHPGRPLVVAMTGTDLYGDLPRNRWAACSVEWATRLVVLQPEGIAAVPARFRAKARAILQSSMPPAGKVAPPRGELRIFVAGHLRAVKDPFRAAMAARLLPVSSRIRVFHLGRALTPGAGSRARREMARNPRYRWLGEVPRRRALRILAGSRLMILSSRIEGGANILSEALVAGVPVLASRIPGSVGILGRDYPGFFPPGDTRRLAALMERAESDPRFLARLAAACRRLASRHRPAREREAWKRLLREVTWGGREPGSGPAAPDALGTATLSAILGEADTR